MLLFVKSDFTTRMIFSIEIFSIKIFCRRYLRELQPYEMGNKWLADNCNIYVGQEKKKREKYQNSLSVCGDQSNRNMLNETGDRIEECFLEIHLTFDAVNDWIFRYIRSYVF